jgi:hypothetical protein
MSFHKPKEDANLNCNTPLNACRENISSISAYDKFEKVRTLEN